MHLKWKGLLVVILICTFSALLLASNTGYSAPRTADGPLGYSMGKTTLAVTGTDPNFTMIPTAGYRQITIYLSIEPILGATTVKFWTLPVAERDDIGHNIGGFKEYDTFDLIGVPESGTYEVKGNYQLVYVENNLPATTKVNVVWYLTA